MNGESNGRKFKDDRVLNLINTNFISLKDKDMKRNNEILHQIVNEVVKAVKEKNEFFKDHYQQIMFVGSYYKGTKVGKPEEFDLDLIIQLPMKYEQIEFDGNVPGYTRLKLNADIYKPGWQRYSKILSKWVTPEGYLNQEEFRQYMESSFQHMPKTVTIGDDKYALVLRKSGPAFTLCVNGPDSLAMSVDLVPVLEFKNQPPVPGDFKGGNWFAVPKSNRSLSEPHLYWRMSFYNLEKAMLKRNGALKPVIRNIKKLRDTADWKLIASYHIETLFMHRVKAMESQPELQKYSTTEHFMDMLVSLKDACEANKITNFWDKSHNLIEDVKPAQLASIKGRLEKIIKHIEKDPFAIADYVLTKEERSSIEAELCSYRDAGKSSKSTDQQSDATNDAKLMHSKSSNIAPSSELSNTLSSGLFAALSFTAKALLMPEKPSESAVAPQEKTPIVAAVKNGKTCSDSAEKNGGFAEIMNMLKLIHSEIADTKDAVNLLTRRVAAVEEKMDILLSGPKSQLNENSLPTQLTPNDQAARGLLGMAPSSSFFQGIDSYFNPGGLLN